MGTGGNGESNCRSYPRKGGTRGGLEGIIAAQSEHGSPLIGR